MSLKKRKANDLKQQKLNAVILGESGVGKTYLVRTLPNLEKVLFVNVHPYENGTLSISDLPMDIVDVASVDDVKELVEGLKKDTKYDTVFFDSLTALSKVSLEYATLQNGADGFKRFDDHSVYLTNFLLDMKSINKHVIFTCLPELKDSPEGLQIYTFALDGKKFTKNLEARVDAVLAMSIDAEDNRKFLTQSNRKWVAKVRAPKGVNLDKVIDADLGVLMNKLGLK